MSKIDLHPTFNCTGITAGRHAPQLSNLPNKKNLEWQLGTAVNFRREMLERLKITTPNGEFLPTPESLLADLVTDPQTDWAAALIDSWSVIGEVLCFYQERLINEGFIGTAEQAESISLLNASLGQNHTPVDFDVRSLKSNYRMPSTAGSAQIILQVKDGKGMPGIQTIPRNSSVRRVSPKGSGVHYFLTSKETQLRSEWNSLTATISPDPAEIYDHPTPGPGRIFSGIFNSIKVGQILLLKMDNTASSSWYLLEITNTRLDTLLKQTTVTWKAVAHPGNLPPIFGTNSRSHFQYFSQTVLPFGAKAPKLSDQPLSMRINYVGSGGIEEWEPVSVDDNIPREPIAQFNNALPPYRVNDILYASNGLLYLATDDGVFYCNSTNKTWNISSQGLLKRAVQTLTEDKNGILYAGTANGGVYRSLGNGAPWSSLPAGYIIRSKLIGKSTSLRTSLPSTTVHKLTLGSEFTHLSKPNSRPRSISAEMVIAATDNGLFKNDQMGSGWFNIPYGKSVQTETNDSGTQPQSPTPALDCQLISHADNDYILTVAADHMQVVEWPKTNTSAQQKKKTVKAQASEHGLSKVPGILMIVYDTLAKIGEVSASPVVKVIKTVWQSLSKTPTLIHRFLEWVTHVDPQHWSNINLPYPGSKVIFEGKFISLQLINVNATVFLMLSTSKGVYSYDKRSGLFQLMMDGLPSKIKNAITLSPAPIPVAQKSAALLTLVNNVIYGFFPTDPIPPMQSLSGNWQPLVILSNPKTSIQKAPHYPPIAHCGTAGKFFTLRPLCFLSDWPNFNLGGGREQFTQIDVTGLKGTIPENMGGVICNAENNYFLPFEIKEAVPQTRNDFGVKSNITRLSVQAIASDFDIQKFDRRTAKILIGSKEIFVSPQNNSSTPVTGGKLIQVNGILPELANKPLAVTGRLARAILLPLGGLQSWSFKQEYPIKTGSLYLPLQSVTSLVQLPEKTILALTNKGLWKKNEDKWVRDEKGLETNDLHILQAISGKNGACYLLTRNNLYQRQSTISNWEKITEQKSQNPFSCFYPLNTQSDQIAHDQYLIGTDGKGLLLLNSRTASYKQIKWNCLPDNAKITALTQMPDGSIYIATNGYGLIYANSTLEAWQPVDIPETLLTISLLRKKGNSLVLSSDRGDLYTLTKIEESFQLSPLSATPHNDCILDLVITESLWVAGLNGGGVICSSDEGHSWKSLHTGICNHVQALLPLEDNWLIATAPKTALKTDDHTYDVTTEEKFCIKNGDFSAALDCNLVSSRLLAFFDRAKTKSPKKPIIEVLVPGETWILKEDEPNAKKEKNTASFLLQRHDEAIIICQNSPALTIIDCQSSNAQFQNSYCFEIENMKTAMIDVIDNQISLLPSRPQDKSTTYLTKIMSTRLSRSQETTILELSQPCKPLFDARSVQLCANIVALSQGQLIENEILGDGNSSLAFQSFTLKAGPLVFDKLEDTAITSTLSVYVNGEPFEQVESFTNSSPQDRVFILTLDEKGIATITFGDGTNGCRLPTGVSNVRTNYRANMPNFDAHDEKAVFILTEPPYGVSSLAVPAQQTPPVISDLTKKERKGSALLPDRLVTFSDYETLAANLPNFEKIKLQIIQSNKQRVLKFSIAGKTPEEKTNTSSAVQEIQSTIAKYSLAPQMPIEIFPARLCSFSICATLTIDMGRSNFSVDAVGDLAYQKLSSVFGYSAQKIGSTVSLNMVQRTLQASSFVQGVTINALHFTDEPQTCHDLKPTSDHQQTNEGESLIYLGRNKGNVTLLLNITSKNTTHTWIAPSQKARKGEIHATA